MVRLAVLALCTALILPSFAHSSERRSRLEAVFAQYLLDERPRLARDEFAREKIWLNDLADIDRTDNLSDLIDLFELTVDGDVPNRFFSGHAGLLYFWQSGFLAKAAKKIEFYQPNYFNNLFRRFRDPERSPDRRHTIALIFSNTRLERFIPNFRRVAQREDDEAGRYHAIWVLKHIGGWGAVDALNQVNETLRARRHTLIGDGTIIPVREYLFSLDLSQVIAQTATAMCSKALKPPNR